MTLQDLLCIEDDPAFVAIRCPDTGVLAWPTLREDVIRLVMTDRFYGAEPLVDTGRKVSAVAVGRAAARAALANLRVRPRRSPVLLWASGAGLVVRDGVSFNRYIDHFADALPGRTWAIEGLFGDQWPAAPRHNRRLSFTAPYKFAVAVAARARIRPRHRRLASRLVELAATRADKILDWRLSPERRRYLEGRCALRLASHTLQWLWLTRWLGKVRPRLLIVEQACYPLMAAYNAAARDAGVTVAEFQHGIVTRGTEAYNVAPTLAASDAYRRTQPHAFLGYGAWGNQQFNAPVERVVIGNPHRELLLRGVSPHDDRRDVVVLGEGFETELYFDLCARLARQLPEGLRLVFRPHPIQRRQVFAMKPPDGVVIDREIDIYQTLPRADAVIGEVSTALFDSIGLARRIFVWSTAKSLWGLPNHPFATFETPEEFGEKVRDPDHGVASVTDVDEFWAPDWRSRFTSYVESITEASR